ncbi:DUF2797 domain-containing protein [Capnocytophaga sp. G1920]|uniref:DUF2797 domain-containing protein n=1 Tax=Capnocytophaga sp. G1920 TaxID=3448875 RepID=UPI0025952168|nr:DUF2797 domain-containing protein [uncultured Capnocytophaga sp.]
MFQGVLQKMLTEWADPIRYYLPMEGDFVLMNQLIGKDITLQFVRFQCMNCGENKPIFRQGYCKECFFEVPQTADWVMHPELSKAHLNIEERDLGYEQQMQLQPHYVYLANSSDVKVGVTRKSQAPTRWIDQGAHEALILAEVPNRYLAGIAEVALKAHIADKTNWRKMLTNQITPVDLLRVKLEVRDFVPDQVQPYITEDITPLHIHFPVEKYPTQVRSLQLVQTPTYSGKLMGIKGQYLIFSDNTVFNVRGNEGLVIQLTIDN